ncbi:MAG TPA: DUF4476 domain-containing protein [Puia sp.]|jgi:hypothetical protein|nr:DUF4476 domain-containing protein [Puia sp.]
MSKLGLVIVMLLTAGRTIAQNYPGPNNEPPTYFVLIQADDAQAFYVRLNSQLYSSSPAGHLILAQLADSVYAITVGFPGQAFPEQRYLLNIHQRDWALRLGRQDNRWGLYDAQGQALATVMDPAVAERPVLAGMKKDDAFSQLMSAIVQDTAVMYNTFGAASADSVRQAVVKSPDSMQATVVSAAVHPGIRESSGPAVPSAPTGVIKLSEHKSSQSLSLVYTDHLADKKPDTIDVVIPVDSPAAATRRPDSPAAVRLQSPDTPRSKSSLATAHSQSPADTLRSQLLATTHLQSPDTSQSIAASHSSQSPDTSRLIAAPHRPQSPDTPHSSTSLRRPQSPDTSNSLVPAAKPKPDSLAAASAAPHKSTLPFVNSDCHAFATDYDVDKLRVRMLSAENDDDRIQTAYKIFKIKCFSTRQIRALTEVFTTDAAKFKFLGTAYPFVSDGQFPELGDVFSDPGYAGKFRTMTAHQ